MEKINKYFLLSALFLVGFLVVQFTDIYGDSAWFKFFLIICAVSFFAGGISKKGE